MSAPVPQPSAARPALVVAAALRLEALAVRRGAPGLAVVRTGMGPERALRAARRLRHHPARAVAVAGVCGALDGSLVPGDVVVASALLRPDGARFDLEAEPLYEALAGRGLRVRMAAIAGAPSVRSDPGAALAAGARAVDMESAWLAESAAGRPFGVVRVVVDGPGHPLFHPGILVRGARGLAQLAALAPALQRWAAGQLHPAAGAPAPRAFHAAL